MALASTVPSSLTCRRASCATLAAVMPVGCELALVLSTLPPNMGQSCGGKPWASAATVTLAPSNREITARYLIPKVSTSLHCCGFLGHHLKWTGSTDLRDVQTLSSFRTSILSDYWNGKNGAAKRAAATESQICRMSWPLT